MLGPRECRIGREEYVPALGVVPGSSAMELRRKGIGVIGAGLDDNGASDRGGDGGVASGCTLSTLECGGVEAAVGETAVVICGGLAITAQARTFVAALSDERAVHKGTGAQGIYLFTETYGW